MGGEGREDASRSLLPRRRRMPPPSASPQKGAWSPPVLVPDSCRGDVQSASLMSAAHQLTARPDLQLLPRCEEKKDGFAEFFGYADDAAPPRQMQFTGPAPEDCSTRFNLSDSDSLSDSVDEERKPEQGQAEFFDCDDASTPDVAASDSARSNPDLAAAQDTGALWHNRNAVMLHEFFVRAGEPSEKKPKRAQTVDPHRHVADINALLARGWERPDVVRHMRRELQRLQQQVEAGVDHRRGITPGSGESSRDRTPRGGQHRGSAPRSATPRGTPRSATPRLATPRGATPRLASRGPPPGPPLPRDATPAAAPRTPRATRSRPPADPRTAGGSSPTRATVQEPTDARLAEDGRDDPFAEGPANPAEMAAAAPAVPKLDLSGVLGGGAGASEGAGKSKGKGPPPKGKGKGKGPPPPTGPPVNATATPEATSLSSPKAEVPETPAVLTPPGGKGGPPPLKGKGKGKGPPPPPPPAKKPVAPEAGSPSSSAAEAEPPAALPPRGGKGGPPPPKGKGKGAAATAAPKARPKPSAPLFGRRLDWHSLPQEKVSGTVFEDFNEEVQGQASRTVSAEDITRLKALFEQPKACPATPNKETTGAKPKCLELLSAKRAQNILIALRRQPLSEQTVRALERLDLEGASLCPEACQVLMNALPTPEEAALLVQHRERASEMRELERTLLPLACLEKPSATQRLRIVLFARTRVELASDLRSAFRELKGAFGDARASVAFRTVLQHTAHLGNVINYGAVKADDRVAAGFSLEALPKLCLFKSASDQRITLLHVLVSQILVTKPSLPEALRDDLAGLKAAKRWQLKTLAEDVAMYCKEAENVAAVFGSMTLPVPDCSQCAPTENADEIAYRQIAELSKEAAEEAKALQAELAEVREAARQALSFFAVPARPAEQDSKAPELLGLLDSFQDSFHRCVQELASNVPLAAKVRSPNGTSEKAESPPTPKAEATPTPTAEAPPAASSALGRAGPQAGAVTAPPQEEMATGATMPGPPLQPPTAPPQEEMATGATTPGPPLQPQGGAAADVGRRQSGLEWLGSAATTGRVLSTTTALVGPARLLPPADSGGPARGTPPAAAAPSSRRSFRSFRSMD